MPDLTGNSAVDVAIGLSFVFLLFSILCSAVQEGIAGIFDLRAATLEKGLRSLLEDNGAADQGGAPAAVGSVPAAAAGGQPQPVANATRDLTKELLGHGLIRGLYKQSTFLFNRRRRGPSYIPANTFALALLNVLAPKNYEDSMPQVRTAISGANLPAGTKNALLTLANGAAKDRDHLRKLLEQWFDGAMERVSGWYKRRAQWIICGLSLVVAVGLNVNTVGIANRLIHDNAIRTAVVKQATDSPPKPGSPDATAAAVGEVHKLGLPFGWNKPKGDPARPDLSKHLGRTIGGWMLTFIALSLGAPFWFDTLSKLARLRNTGPPPSAQQTGHGPAGGG